MADTSIGPGGTLTKSDYTTFLKEWYQGTTVADLVFKKHPFLGIIPKNPGVRGLVYPKPIRYANITGQSATYLTAHEQQSPAARDRWEVVHTDNYAKATVSNKAMELAEGEGAFRDALTDAVDSAHSAFANDLHFELLARYAKGARAKVASVAGAVLTLGSGEARFFEKGLRVQRSDVNQTALDHSGEIQIVTAVDRANDKITLDADFTTVSVGTDFIYRAGDFGLKADSLGAWLPGSAVTATPFRGVVRTDDKTRLAGVDGVNGNGETNPLTYAMVHTGAALGTQEGSPTHILSSYMDHAKLADETEQRGRYAKVTSTDASISYSALEIMTGAGAVPVVADAAVADDTFFMIDTGTMEMYSAGGVPRLFNKDGNFYHREETADSLAFYLFGFYGLVCWNPGGNSFNQKAYSA